MGKKTKDIVRTLFFFLLALFFVLWFVCKLSPRERTEILASFAKVNYFWVILAVAVAWLSIYIRALRWRLLIKPLGFKTKATDLCFAIFSCYLTNLAVPRLGEVVRCTMLTTRYKIPFDKTLGTIICERAVDMFLFVTIFFVSALVQYKIFKDYLFDNFSLDWNKYVSLLFVLLCGLLLLTALFFVFRKKIVRSKIYFKIVSFVKGIWQGVKTIAHLEHPFLFVFYSLLIWFLWILGTLIIFRSISACDSLGFLEALTVTVLGSVGIMITPGGIGLYPGIFAQTLYIFSVAKPLGYALGWINWLVSQIGPIVIGPIGFVIFSRKRKAKQDDSTDRTKNIGW